MKKVISMLLVLCMILSLAACAKKTEEQPADTTKTEQQTKTETTEQKENKPTEAILNTESKDDVQAEENKDVINELSDGLLVEGKFAEPVKITVEVYNRDGHLDCTDNMYTDYIKQGVKEAYNIDVEFVAVPRWTEVEQINSLLAGHTAPDICYTYNWETVQKYGEMNGVADMSEWLTPERKGLFPNLWSWLGEEGLTCRQDLETGSIWAIEGRRVELWKSNTFVRQDWLDALGLAVPTNIDEFEAMLVAFRDNAELLLGEDADKMVPFTLGQDAGWRLNTMIESFMDPDITDREHFINGFDDRNYLQQGCKEAVAVANKWYNMGLLWKDFALYPDGDPTGDDMCKAGFVGAFIHNYDYPFREDGINANLALNVSEDAKFVAINPFQDSKGNNTKYYYAAIGSDRKIFFPFTNDNILASLLYLDWITDPAHVEYLQIGEEGITHEVLDSGAIKTIPADEDHINTHEIKSLYNIDYTMTTNGLRLSTNELTLLSKYYGYAGIDPADIENAINAAGKDAKNSRFVPVRQIASEGEVGSSLTEVRNESLCKAITASTDQFDAVWEEGMQNYLASGGQDIIDERADAWEEKYGDAEMLP